MTDCCEGFERSDGAVMHSKDCALSTPQPESVDDVRAALAEAIDALRASTFVTSQSMGDPNPSKRAYQMVLRYPTMDALHTAHEAILSVRKVKP